MTTTSITLDEKQKDIVKIIKKLDDSQLDLVKQFVNKLLDPIYICSDHNQFYEFYDKKNKVYCIQCILDNQMLPQELKIKLLKENNNQTPQIQQNEQIQLNLPNIQFQDIEVQQEVNDDDPFIIQDIPNKIQKRNEFIKKLNMIKRISPGLAHQNLHLGINHITNDMFNGQDDQIDQLIVRILKQQL